MRVAYVITRADAVGGASVHVRDMARYMAASGHAVMVFVGGEGPVTQQLQETGVAYRRLRFLRRAVDPLRDLRAMRELTSSLKGFQPDLISLHTAKAGFIGRIAAGRLGVPALYTPHGWAFGERFPLTSRSAFLLAERLVAARSATTLCVCAYERELALRRGVGRPEQLRVVYNGVHDVPAGLCADAGRSPVRFVSVTRLERPKDPATLLCALGRLRDRAWGLDLVGDGPMEAGLRHFADTLGIGDRVHFLGYQTNPASILAQAQVFVLSSWSESFPRSILEGLRTGLPVVASRVGGVAEAITEGENGLLVPPADVEALASALASLMNNAELRARMGKQARQGYEARFRFERMAGELLSIYHEFA